VAILAIDQGTTSTRSLVLDDKGHSHITLTREHQQFYPQSNWVEHDPEEIIKHILDCIHTTTQQYHNITAIGIDNQGESCLAWHAETKQAVSPIIVWQDARSQETINQLKQNGFEQEVLKRSGLPLDAYFSASKLAWIIQNIPQAATLLKQGLLRLGTTDAFFLDRLTGKFVTDITTASRTSLMNLKTGQWDERLCQLFNVPIECLPALVPTTGDFGIVESNGQKIPIKASVCDQQAALYGHGCRKKGDAKITFGTGAFALALSGTTPKTSTQGLVTTVAWQLQNQQPQYALDGGVYNAGSAINWAKSLGLFDSYEQINTFTKPSAVERGLVFVPALSGLACPHWDRSAAGLWIGLSLDTDAKDMMQAILEGIAFRTAEVIKAIELESDIGSSISIDGGLSANPYFCQFLANCLNKTIRVQRNAELTAFGTALLASDLKITAQTTDIKRYLPTKINTSLAKTFDKAVQRSLNWTL